MIKLIPIYAIGFAICWAGQAPLGMFCFGAAIALSILIKRGVDKELEEE